MTCWEAFLTHWRFKYDGTPIEGRSKQHVGEFQKYEVNSDKGNGRTHVWKVPQASFPVCDIQ